jgi:hypothetical protein
MHAPQMKAAIKTLTFYAASLLIIGLINMSGEFRSGPCAPDLDVLSILCIGPLSLIFLIINIFQKLLSNRPTTYSAVIHSFIFIVWILMLSLS